MWPTGYYTWPQTRHPLSLEASWSLTVGLRLSNESRGRGSASHRQKPLTLCFTLYPPCSSCFAARAWRSAVSSFAGSEVCRILGRLLLTASLAAPMVVRG